MELPALLNALVCDTVAAYAGFIFLAVETTEPTCMPLGIKSRSLVTMVCGLAAYFCTLELVSLLAAILLSTWELPGTCDAYIYYPETLPGVDCCFLGARLSFLLFNLVFDLVDDEPLANCELSLVCEFPFF